MATTAITVADGNFSAYVASPRVPTGGSKAVGIVVIQEIFGVNKVMRELCDALAAQGYLAICPDLFWRQEPGIELTDRTDAEWQRAFQLYQGFDERAGVEDLKASLDHIKGFGSCSGKVGTIGYCLGGKLAYLMATRSTADCSVSYYGVGIENALNEADKIYRPLLMHVAAEDRFVPKESQAKIMDALGANRNIVIHLYPGVDHAFARVGGAHWNAAAAALANERTAKFLAANLG